MNLTTQHLLRPRASLRLTALLVLVLASMESVHAEQRHNSGVVFETGVPQVATEVAVSASWTDVVLQDRVKDKVEAQFAQSVEALSQPLRRSNPKRRKRQRMMGADSFRLDGGTRVVGWQVRDGLYFGKRKGELKGVALIWQRRANQQISLSEKGLRLTRRLH